MGVSYLLLYEFLVVLALAGGALQHCRLHRLKFQRIDHPLVPHGIVRPRSSSFLGIARIHKLEQVVVHISDGLFLTPCSIIVMR